MGKELLKLSRETLNAYFSHNKLLITEKIKKDFSKNQACFITLAKEGDLRGCIGSIYPRQELWRDIIENTMNAAFEDSRFDPLTKDELSKIKIERDCQRGQR